MFFLDENLLLDECVLRNLLGDGIWICLKEFSFACVKLVKFLVLGWWGAIITKEFNTMSIEISHLVILVDWILMKKHRSTNCNIWLELQNQVSRECNWKFRQTLQSSQVSIFLSRLSSYIKNYLYILILLKNKSRLAYCYSSKLFFFHHIMKTY